MDTGVGTFSMCLGHSLSLRTSGTRCLELDIKASEIIHWLGIVTFFIDLELWIHLECELEDQPEGRAILTGPMEGSETTVTSNTFIL